MVQVDHLNLSVANVGPVCHSSRRVGEDLAASLVGAGAWVGDEVPVEAVGEGDADEYRLGWLAGGRAGVDDGGVG